jgi:hypothetical protein
MFIKKTENLLALDEYQLRERASQIQAEPLLPLTRLQISALTMMGTFLVAGCVGWAFPALFIPGLVVTLGTPCAVLGWHRLHSKECRDEARRLNEAADRRVELDNLAKQAAEELPRKAIVLEATTVVKAPLRFKKAPSSPAP